MIAYASKKGLYTMTSTNANLPFDGDQIVASGLDRIIVSMDGATQETYANYRVGGEVSRVLENLERIRIAKKKAHSRTPFVSLQFLVMRHNEHEIGDMQDIARQVEADSLDLKTVQIYKKEDIAYLPKNPAYRRYKVEGDQFELQFGVHNRCRRIWTQPVVNWNGELSMCCYDKDIDYKIGNLKDYSLCELWHGKKLQRLRAQILKNRAALPVCLNCGEGIKQTIRSTR
jgi:MoaA/NifB/PqqE/SkfB family radical SAM enzyme